MTKVYIILCGEQHEGGSVEGVYKSKKKAIDAALKIKPCFEGGWQADEEIENYWSNGCDFLEVIERNVE